MLLQEPTQFLLLELERLPELALLPLLLEQELLPAWLALLLLELLASVRLL